MPGYEGSGLSASEVIVVGLSKLAAKCRACPFVDECDHKQMEAYGFLSMSPQGQVTFSQTTMAESSVRMDGAINIDELVQHAARVFQLPEQVLRGCI